MSAGHSDPFHHIRDNTIFELPQFLGGNTLPLPVIYGVQITKFMVLEVIAALLTIFIFTGLAIHIRNGRPARGGFWNFWEVLALFVRDNIVREGIGEPHHDHGHDDHGGHGHDHTHGHHDVKKTPKLSSADFGVSRVGHPADKFVPYILTIFFFILFCNLLGAIPWLGSPTGNIAVTGALALTVFIKIVVSGSQELGVINFWKRLVPTMDLPGPMGLVIVPIIWVIEVVGLLVKSAVLSVRLFANIMAGHTVIAVFLSFIAAVSWSQNPTLFSVITVSSIGGQLFVGMLELFVAFLQAYIFSYLASLFIGMAIHPH